MNFRSSRFIDFNSGTVTVEPMQLQSTLSATSSVEDMIATFECRVEVWQFGPAVQMLKEMEMQPRTSAWHHAAYALIAILFTYFEMLGKTLNPKSRSNLKGPHDFYCGFEDVYPCANLTREHLKQIHDLVRNGLYHLGYTKNNLLIHNNPAVIDSCIGNVLPSLGRRWGTCDLKEAHWNWNTGGAAQCSCCARGCLLSRSPGWSGWIAVVSDAGTRLTENGGWAG